MNESTAFQVAFIPITFGALMLMGGDFFSRILGAFCCIGGFAVIALSLNNEHQEYLKDKAAEEAMAVQREQMAYIERLEASQEKRG